MPTMEHCETKKQVNMLKTQADRGTQIMLQKEQNNAFHTFHIILTEHVVPEGNWKFKGRREAGNCQALKILKSRKV